MVIVHCSCGERLGRVGPSARSGNPRPVWHIEPGWSWSDAHLGRGTLERRDDARLAERRLLHELTGRQRVPQGMALRRECDLPLVVRCPSCRRIRWVSPEVALGTARVAR
jgi:hypothetical protein